MFLVYFKPLVREIEKPETLSSTNVLRKFAKLATACIREEVGRLPYTHTGRLKRSIKYRLQPKSVKLYSTHPAFRFMHEGVKPHVMRYARNRVVAIPLDKLRTITGRDREQGVGFRQTSDKPMHPGSVPQKFIERGIAKAKEKFHSQIEKNTVLRALRGTK